MYCVNVEVNKYKKILIFQMGDVVFLVMFMYNVIRLLFKLKIKDY